MHFRFYFVIYLSMTNVEYVAEEQPSVMLMIYFS